MKTLIAATAAIALLAGTAGATEYDFRVLDPLPEGLVHYLEHDETEPAPPPAFFGPSAAGELGGNAREFDVGGRPIALRWNSAGEVNPLEPDSVGGSAVFAMNRRGDIVGWHADSGPTTAAIWHSDGTRTDLPPLPFTSSSARAFGINDFGVVVGDSNVAPVVWDKFGNVERLPLPDPTSAWNGVAWSINKSGIIFGQAFDGRISPVEFVTIIWCPKRCR